MQVLAGDIGGTKTLLAVCEVGAGRIEVQASGRYDSRKYPGLAAICQAFAQQLGRPLPAFAGFGVAGPVNKGRWESVSPQFSCA